MTEIRFKELSYAVIGAAMEVHRILGPGFLENVYHGALIHELCLRGIPAESKVKLPMYYKEVMVGNYEADLVVAGKIILELKAVEYIHEKHLAQAHHYLTATGLDLAIVINFGEESLKSKRVVRKAYQPPS